MEGSASSMTSSSSSLEMFTNLIGSMPYMDFGINIYKLKSQHPPRYVYMPALLLDRCNPESRRNQVSGRAELLFTIHMWDEELEAKVFEYVTKRDATVQPHQIQVIPFASVIVTSSAPSLQSSGWMSYRNIRMDLRVSLTCSSMEEADRLAGEMKTDPSQFLPILKIKFSLETQKVLRKEICISIEHIRDGELFGQLLQHFPGAETALLTADGVERLISESLTKVVANSFDDNEVVTKDSVLYSKLRDLIVDSQVTINEQSKGMWDSVFWDKDNYRPDRAAKIIVDAYNHSDDQSRSKLRDIFSGTLCNLVVVDQMFQDDGKQTNSKTNFYDAQPREELTKVIKNSKNYVEWNVEKFQPKPMSLTRVHLAKFTDRQTFQDSRVTVPYSLATLTTDLNISSEGRSCSADRKLLDTIKLTLLDQIDEMKTELKKHRELIDVLQTTTQKQIDEIKEKLTNQVAQKDRMFSAIQKQNAEINRNRESQTKLLASVSWGTTGFVWRIDNVKTRIAKAEILHSDAFYTKQYGYKLKAQVCFKGFADGKWHHLSVAFKLIPGEYDGLLEWPFPLSVTFTLYDQVTDPYEASNVTAELSDMPPKFRLPVTTEEYLGIPKFISHKMLRQRHFIKDDVMFLKISFDP